MVLATRGVDLVRSVRATDELAKRATSLTGDMNITSLEAS